MTCCCNQGKTCPVRATRDAGACNHEPDDAYTDDIAAYIVLMIFAYTIICGWLGYMWAIHGSAIESFLWAIAAKLS